jgi:DNA-binding IclR family transcriptional regulator
MAILETFVEGGPELTLTQISARTRLTPSTAYRLVTNLVRLGYLSPNGRSDYRLGNSVLRLAGTVLTQLDLRRKAAPALERLRDEVKETVHLATLDDQRIIYLDKLEGLYAIGMTGSRVGKTAPVHCTALGKVMVAMGDEAQRTRILRSELKPQTPRSITDPDKLRSHLLKVRKQGYALDWGEYEAEVRCVAAPVRDHAGRVVAAISVSGPAQRMEPEIESGRVLPRLLAAASEISKALGGLGDQARSTAAPARAGRRPRR